MKIIAVGALALVSLATIPQIQTKHTEFNEIPRIETSESVETVEISSDNEKAQEQPEMAPEIETPKLDPVKDNPNKCNLDVQWVWDDYTCHDKRLVYTGVVPDKVSAPANGRVPVGVHDIGGVGDCAAEIAKYNWNQNVALAVARAESGLRPGVINNNPGTRDYSIGCFQVNIYGANARNRPSQEQLINAAVNVQWAYNNYLSNGGSFVGQWGVCRKISCY